MDLESLAHECQLEMHSEGVRTAPCPRDAYVKAKADFLARFGFELPEEYGRLMAVSNGFRHNGMTIPPVTAAPGFHSRLVDLNVERHANARDGFVYLGQFDDELYGWDAKRRTYCAIEFRCRDAWITFSSALGMFDFLLRRGLDLPNDESAGGDAGQSQ